eukprot:45818_1
MLQVIDHGVFILRSFMNSEEQLKCFQQCSDLYKKDQIMYEKHGSISYIVKNIKVPHRGRYLLTFEPNINLIPNYYNNLGQSVIDHLYTEILKHKQCNLILETLPRKLPTTYIDTKDEKQNELQQHEIKWISDRLNCVLYPLGSLLGRHVDNMNGWVVLFSLGCDAKFYLQLLSNEKRRNGFVLSMKSGDVIVFEGGDKTRVLHGVDSIVQNSSPQHLKNTLKNARIGLQLRQYIGIETHKAN